MKWYGHPTLKFRTGDKLHISKEPGLASWATLLSITSLGIAADYYVIPDNFLSHAGFLSLCLVLGLNFMEKWEDFILDREENLATIVYRSWYHGFSMKVPEENVKRFPLNCICSVVINTESGIDVIQNDGTNVTVASDDKCTRCLRKLRKEISTFLHLERVEYLKGDDKHFYDWDDELWLLSHFSENHDSDTESQDSIEVQDSEFHYGRNLKIISGAS